MPLRHPKGRHRRPSSRSVGAPVYLATVALTAAAAGSLNVPQAVGDTATERETAVLGIKVAVEDEALTRAVVAAQIQQTQQRSAIAEAARASVVQELATKRKADLLREQRRKQAAVRATRKARADRAARAEAREERAARVEREARVEAEAEEARSNRWVVPTSSYRLTAGFGDAGRLWSSSHTGQDFAAPSGTQVYAAAAGTVVSAGYDGSYGNKIVVQHADGTETWYAHLTSFEVTGGSVEAGQVIGGVGSTGNSTGPHLHFEVRPGGGGPVPPISWLREHGAGI